MTPAVKSELNANHLIEEIHDHDNFDTVISKSYVTKIKLLNINPEIGRDRREGKDEEGWATRASWELAGNSWRYSIAMGQEGEMLTMPKV